MKNAPSRDRHERFAPPRAGTDRTLRWPTLLSLGTSRHSCTDSVPVKLPDVARVPVRRGDHQRAVMTVTFSFGTHSNGPTTTPAPPVAMPRP